VLPFKRSFHLPEDLIKQANHQPEEEILSWQSTQSILIKIDFEHSSPLLSSGHYDHHASAIGNTQLLQNLIYYRSLLGQQVGGGTMGIPPQSGQILQLPIHTTTKGEIIVANITQTQAPTSQ
jgi:hypothetical protein